MDTPTDLLLILYICFRLSLPKVIDIGRENCFLEFIGYWLNRIHLGMYLTLGMHHSKLPNDGYWLL